MRALAFVLDPKLTRQYIHPDSVDWLVLKKHPSNSESTISTYKSHAAVLKEYSTQYSSETAARLLYGTWCASGTKLLFKFKRERTIGNASVNILSTNPLIKAPMLRQLHSRFSAASNHAKSLHNHALIMRQELAKILHIIGITCGNNISRVSYTKQALYCTTIHCQK